MRNGAWPQSYAPVPAGMLAFGTDSTVLPFRPVAAEEASIGQETSAASLPATKEVCINDPMILCFKLHRAFSLTRLRLYVCRTSHVWQITGCQSPASKRSMHLFVGNVNASGGLRIPPCAELVGRVEKSASHSCDRGSFLFTSVRPRCLDVPRES